MPNEEELEAPAAPAMKAEEIASILRSNSLSQLSSQERIGFLREAFNGTATPETFYLDAKDPQTGELLNVTLGNEPLTLNDVMQNQQFVGLVADSLLKGAEQGSEAQRLAQALKDLAANPTEEKFAALQEELQGPQKTTEQTMEKASLTSLGLPANVLQDVLSIQSGSKGMVALAQVEGGVATTGNNKMPGEALGVTT